MMLCLTVCLLIFGKGVARWSDRTVAVRAEAADLQEELHNIRLQERVLEARILETGG